ncbi:MAG: PAS domain S-box protein [Nitrospirae bacterium]|nr:PAS domain S-box protein [Nitrospirota bacterium]
MAHLFVLALLTVFFTEVAVMFVLARTEWFSGFVQNALADAFLLTLVASPFLAYLIVRPLRSALLVEQDRSALVVKHARDAIIVADVRGRIVSWNPEAEGMFGYSAGDAIGNLLTMVIPERFRAAHEDGMRRAANSVSSALQDGGKPVEMWGMKQNGTEFPVELTLARGGSHIVGVLRDITKRRKAEDESALLRDVAVGIAEAESVEDAFRVVLRKVMEATGWSYSEAWSLSDHGEWLECRAVWPMGDDRFTALEKEARGLQCRMGRGLPGMAWASAEPIMTEDLTTDPALIRMNAVTAAGLKGAVALPSLSGNKVIGVLVFFTAAGARLDSGEVESLLPIAAQAGTLMDRKRSDEMLRTLSGTMAQAADPIVLTDREGRIEYVNPAFEELTGWSGEEVLGQTPRVLRSGKHDLRFYESLWSTILAGGVFRGEFLNKKKNGEPYNYQQTISPVLNSSGEVTGFIATGKDMTQTKRLEGERERVSKLESVGVLAGGIAHDFNNILTAVIGNISVAKREVGDGTDLHAILSEAESASRRAKALTQQLLTFARGGAPVRRVVNLAKPIRSSSELMLSGSSARCEFSVPADLWPAEVDPGQIQQVMQNLVANAVQAMPPGGTVRVSLRNVEASGTVGTGLAPGRYVELGVSDTGSGIAPEHLPKVFDPYFTTKSTGSGLGLAVCHSIVKNHGGHIEIQSEVGRGTTVKVWLPATDKIPTPHSRASVEVMRGKGRVLVMDDEAPVRSVAARMLKSLGYEVEVAADGKQAIELYSRHLGNGGSFDVVLMDLTVPGGMGGKEAMARILEINPAVTAVVSSGYSEDPVLAEFKSYGFRGRVAKPYTLEELGRVLHEVQRNVK